MKDQELFREYKENPTIEKRNEIVEKYLYMVEILVKKYLGKGVEYDDLYQVGAMALVLAVERYDISRGFEFSSFATPTILGEIKKYFRDKQWSLKVPRRIKEISSKVNAAAEILYNRNSRKPTIEEIAEETGYSVEDVMEASEGSKAYGTYSLNRTFDDSGDEGDSSVFEKYTGFDEKGYIDVEVREIVSSVYDTFDEKNRYIFKERFIHGRSQSDIARELGISQMTVSRTEKKMIQKFREELGR